MNTRDRLIELLQGNLPHFENEVSYWGNEHIGELADYLIANGVTVNEWISVDDELPKYTDEYNVTVGVPSEFGYFEKVTTLRFERINGKEPRWVIPKNEIYNVISWMPLPESPNGVE